MKKILVGFPLLSIVLGSSAWAVTWETVREWKQALEFEGSRHIISGRLLRDPSTGEEREQYFDSNGTPLPDFLFQNSRRSWSPRTIREAHAAVQAASPAQKTATPKAVRAVAGLPTAPVSLRLGTLDRQAVAREDEHLERSGFKAKRMGVFRDLPLSVGPTLPNTGRWQTLPDGAAFWSVRLVSPNAIAIRAHIESAQLPAGCAILAFDSNDRSTLVGPYTSNALSENGDLWTESIFAADITLGCYVPKGVARHNASFKIDRIIHTYVDPAKALMRKEGPCHNDVACSPQWAQQASAVVGLGTVAQVGQVGCTGCMIADAKGRADIPYMLTAHHCIEDQRSANTTEFYWFYQASACNGTPPSPSDVPRTGGGADWLAGASDSAANDFALLRLRQTPPAGVIYAGWSTRTPAPNETLACIHHPDGSFKRISFGALIDRTANYWHVRWSNGVTEPGSSGSPLFNANHQIIGQLLGGYSSCSQPLEHDEYGRFDVTYPIVQQWLDPVFRGTWYISSSRKGPHETTFGYQGAIPVPADYDGDGQADIAVFFAPQGKWHVFGSKTGYRETQFGFDGVVPVPADYDGDGMADIGVYYPPEGKWHIFGTRSGYSATQFGFAATLPVVADYDGDGKADIGVYYPPEGKWHVFGSRTGYASTQFGFAGTLPVVADYDGDGKADIGVFHPPTGMWKMFGSQTGFREAQFGFDGVIPVPADYDGDGQADIGVYYAPTADWHIFRSRLGYTNIKYGFGGAFPVPADYDGDGKADIGLYY